MRPGRGLSALPVLLAAAALVGPRAVSAQDDLQREIVESQRRLQEIRAQRDQLEAEIGNVRNRVRDTSQELVNIQRRLSQTLSVLEEVEFQTEATSSQIRETQRSLIQSTDRLAESEAVLHRRLRDIYKMGPLHTVQVLLEARSFTDFLNRYRYLQQIASYDQQLVERVRSLQIELADQEAELRQRMSQLGVLRQDRVSEVAELRSVEGQRQSTLEEYRAREETVTTRIEELEADESRMTILIDALDERRRALEAERARAGGPAITTDDAGLLDWPIDDPEVIYSFGREVRPNGIALRWNGIGLAARPGAPVRAVRAGQVVLAGPFEGYGPTVIVSHGDGFYTLYLYLEELGVVEGRNVSAGQVVGTVGGSDTPEGPHVEFQIRAPIQGGEPRAQDPLRWLRPMDGG